MSFTIPQVALQRVIQAGLTSLKNNQDAFNQIFDFYLHEQMEDDYGQEYVDQIWTWFSNIRIPVVQAWAFNKTRIPGVSIHLAQEIEDESKAAIGDFLGNDYEAESEMGVGVFTVNLDIGIHADKTGDEVLWLYYLVSYALFTQKRLAEDLGIELHTFSGSDYNRETNKLPDNIWSRWIRFKCTVENHWESTKFNEIDSVDSNVYTDNP